VLFWHVPAPNEALLISGSKRQNEAAQFRIVTGHGCFVTRSTAPRVPMVTVPAEPAP
jgi:hypothetical protein